MHVPNPVPVDEDWLYGTHAPELAFLWSQSYPIRVPNHASPDGDVVVRQCYS